MAPKFVVLEVKTHALLAGHGDEPVQIDAVFDQDVIQLRTPSFFGVALDTGADRQRITFSTRIGVVGRHIGHDLSVDRCEELCLQSEELGQYCVHGIFFPVIV